MSHLSELDLGRLDAEADPNFDNYSVANDLLHPLVAGKLILVTAPKGYGKSALARLAIAKLGGSVYVLNQSKGFDVQHLETESSAEVRRKLLAFLMGLIVANLASEGRLSKPLTSHILDSKAYKGLQKTLGAVKIKPPFVEIALQDIFPKSKTANVADLLSSNVSDQIKLSLGAEKRYIIIDDADSFASASNDKAQALFLRELIMAAHDISHLKLAGNVYATVLLKQEVFSKIRNEFQEFDKVRTYWLPLKWTDKQLLQIAERRLQYSVQETKAYGDWTHLFQDRKPKKVLDEVFKYSIHGPRNAIEILHNSFRIADQNNRAFLSKSDVTEAVHALAPEKVRDLASFHEGEFPDIVDIIFFIFEEYYMPSTRDDLEAHIKVRLLRNADSRALFENSKWAFRKTARTLIDLFYKIGVVGFQRNERLYFQADEDVAPLSSNVTLDTHPALKSFLNSGAAG